jgi:hypothetical protein
LFDAQIFGKLCQEMTNEVVQSECFTEEMIKYAAIWRNRPVGTIKH